MKFWRGAALGKAETNQMGYCLLLSLVGFLAAGWFLSRAYVMTFFLLGGLIDVIYEAALKQGMAPTRLPLARTSSRALLLMIGLMTVVYLSLRVMNLMH